MDENRPMTFERLLDWIEGRLPEEEATAMAWLVRQANAPVQEAVAWIRAFEALSENTVMVEPPGNLRERLERTFTRHLEERDGEERARLESTAAA